MSVKYLVFDLEATRRENSYLRKLLEQANRENSYLRKLLEQANRNDSSPPDKNNEDYFGDEISGAD